MTYQPKQKEDSMKPGPGNYFPQNYPNQKKEPACKIGSEVRHDLAVKKQRMYQTAPGQYDPLVEYTKMKAVGWRIGNEKRPGMVKKGHDSLPGPAVYEIPSKIVEGPQVHMHAKTDKVD